MLGAKLYTLVAQVVRICLQYRRPGFGKIPRRREWLPTPVFLPRETHGQRSLGAIVHGIAESQTQLSD